MHPQGGDDKWSAELRVTGLDGKNNFTHGHWRKSAQWVALNRQHAALVAAERELLWELGFMYPAGKEWMSRKRCGVLAGQTACRYTESASEPSGFLGRKSAATFCEFSPTWRMTGAIGRGACSDRPCCVRQGSELSGARVLCL